MRLSTAAGVIVLSMLAAGAVGAASSSADTLGSMSSCTSTRSLSLFRIATSMQHIDVVTAVVVS